MTARVPYPQGLPHRGAVSYPSSRPTSSEFPDCPQGAIGVHVAVGEGGGWGRLGGDRARAVPTGGSTGTNLMTATRSALAIGISPTGRPHRGLEPAGRKGLDARRHMSPGRSGVLKAAKLTRAQDAVELPPSACAGQVG